MKNKDFDSSFGIDPRSKSNIRANHKNSPQSIDWEAFAKKTEKKVQKLTPWGLVNNQQKEKK